MVRFVIRRRPDGRRDIEVVAANGETVFYGNQGYERRAAAMDTIGAFVADVSMGRYTIEDLS